MQCTSAIMLLVQNIWTLWCTVVMSRCICGHFSPHTPRHVLLIHLGLIWALGRHDDDTSLQCVPCMRCNEGLQCKWVRVCTLYCWVTVSTGQQSAAVQMGPRGVRRWHNRGSGTSPHCRKNPSSLSSSSLRPALISFYQNKITWWWPGQRSSSAPTFIQSPTLSPPLWHNIKAVLVTNVRIPLQRALHKCENRPNRQGRGETPCWTHFFGPITKTYFLELFFGPIF